MEDAAQVTCFGRSSTAKKASKARTKTKTARTLDLSPLSSINSDEVIKAHRLDLGETAKITNPQQVDLAAELARERAQRQSLEDQLAAALNINAELKLTLLLKDEESELGVLSKKLNRMKPQLMKERKEREDSELQLAAAKREAAALRSALNAARSQRDDLEAELMEAALDVMDGEKQRANFETAVKNEKMSRETAEEAMAEAETLRHKLRTAESARDSLQKQLQAMTLEAGDWELALDALQNQLETALLHRPLESVPASKFDPYAPPTPPQARQPLKESVVKADVVVSKELQKPSPKPEPWRQVVIKRQEL